MAYFPNLDILDPQNSVKKKNTTTQPTVNSGYGQQAKENYNKIKNSSLSDSNKESLYKLNSNSSNIDAVSNFANSLSNSITPAKEVESAAESQGIDYSTLYDQFYNQYLNPKNKANEQTYNNIIANLKNNANDQIDENEINYRRNTRLLKEKMGRLGQTDSGLSTTDFANLMNNRDKTNASIKSQLSSDVATQEANRNSTKAELQNAASTYAANLIAKLKA